MNKLIILLAVLAVSTGCRKYVEIDQKGKRVLTYTRDYRLLLDNSSQLEGGFSLPIYSGDDTRVLDVSKQNAMTDIISNAYTWQAKYWSEAQSDGDWDRLYRIIYVSNEALFGIMDSEGGTDVEKKQLYAEALVHRAYAYWCLVNIYGRQYDNSTSSSDLGVPLLLTPELLVPLNRPSVATVYNQIISDLNQAVESLPALPDYNTRPSKSAVYAMLARTYLMMRDFEKARSNAQQALVLKNGLLNLRTYEASTTGFPYRLDDPEIIFSKINIPSTPYMGVQLDTALLRLLGTSDLRYKLFVKPGASFFPAFTGYGYWRLRLSRETNAITQGPGVPEMMLIDAECAARAGDATAAIGILNKLREKRFNTTDYTPLPVETAEKALVSVVDERKREFFGTGLRWFDQKRLNKDPQFAKTIVRSFKGVDYTLEPNSNRYMFPIGDKYIILNPELQQNER